MEKQVTDQFQQIILKFLAHEASEQEVLKLKKWLEESTQNRKIFDKSNELWHLNKKSLKKIDLNTDSAWNKLNSKVKTDNSIPNTKPLIISRNKYVMYRVAAVALLVIGLAFSLFWLSEIYNNENNVVTIFAPEGEKTKVQLADKTMVWLNSGSMLKYSSDFSQDNRVVSIEGEAYFDVSHDKSNPFIVNTKKTKIKVWGTRFNVRAYTDENIIETTLEKGSISVKLPNRKKDIYIKPGQQLVFTKSNSSVKLKKVDIEMYTAWKHHILKFDNAEFNEIIKKLERWYGVHIVLDNKMKYSERYTMTIKTESLREVLKRIKITTPIDYKIEVDSVFIYSKK